MTEMDMVGGMIVHKGPAVEAFHIVVAERAAAYCTPRSRGNIVLAVRWGVAEDTEKVYSFAGMEFESPLAAGLNETNIEEPETSYLV